MVTATAAPAANSASGAQGQAQSAPSRPWRASTFRTLSTDGYSIATALGTTAAQLTPYTPSPNSFLRGIWLQVQGVASGNSATVAFNGDAPQNVIQSITFQDSNQKPILGPFDGYTLAQVVNKFGGYNNLGDPRASAVYSVTTGSGASGGSFTYVVYVPMEVASRDGLGALQNKSSSSSFQLVVTLNTLANVYSTAPTAAPTVTVTALEDGWAQPKPTDLSGNALAKSPPQLGTTQYWTRGSYNGLNGSVQTQLTQGLGYPIRNFVAVNYDVSAGTRAAGDTDFPTTTQFLFKGTSMWNVPKTLWKDQMSRAFGYYSTTADAANGLENGVYVQPFNQDFSNAPGDELRNGYLATQQGDQYQMVATFNGNSNLYWVANYVAPAAGASNLASIQPRG